MIKPVIIEFLRERGLKLSEEKTLITHITEGFNFLGQRVRKYGNKLLIRPTRQSVRSVLEKARQRIRRCRGLKAAVLIRQLNPLLRGWANYHRHVASKRTFDRVGYCVRTMLWRWARRNHPNKSWGWSKRRYYTADQKGAFTIWTHDREGKRRVLCAYPVARTIIECHIKVRGEATPYEPEYVEYFEKRRCFAWRTYPVRKPRAFGAGKDKLRSRSRNGLVQLGADLAWRTLDVAQDPIAESYFADQKLQDGLQRRNESMYGHGQEPIDMAEVHAIADRLRNAFQEHLPAALAC